MRKAAISQITPVVRCVAYTRKSTDDGLDSDFNSLDAQREACEAYVASQKHEGWVLLPEHYDDGGFTGANTDRPALQRLMADIRAGKIDTILVYKVDRLSRSLLDFAKLIEFFDLHGVSFISITQHFATNTAIGKLTLNMLLSFAAFERDIISERVRDKIAGAKRKGKFTGGRPVLGYDIDPTTHKLVVNPTEAETVKRIFRRFSELGSGQAVAQELNDQGITTKSRTNKQGIFRPGSQWTASAIYYLMNNRTYLGETKHKDQTYPGEHEAIVSQSLWNRAHAMLTHDGYAKRRRHESEPALLRGIIRCGCCDFSMYSTYTRRRGKTYRYYLCTSASKKGYRSCPIRTVAAGEIESAVLNQLRAVFRTPEMIAQTYRAALELFREEQAEGRMPADVVVTEAEVAEALRKLDPVWNELFPAEQRKILQLLVERVVVYENDLDVRIRTDGLRSLVSEIRGKSSDTVGNATLQEATI